MKKLFLSLIAALLTFSTACSSASLENISNRIADVIAETAGEDNEYVQIVKNASHADYPDLTYGGAFTNFFRAPRWEYVKGVGGQDTVEFTGDCMYQNVVVNAWVQFVINKEDKSFVATRLNFSDAAQDAETLAILLNAVFEEAENAVGDGAGGEGSSPAASVQQAT